MEEIDIVIVGAGIIGLAIAKEIAVRELNLVVLERNSSFGQETSSRNSEVIHSGIYYPSGSLKANACVEGKNLMYETCRKNNIPFKKIGKLIVATDKDELSFLEGLLAQGRDNGVEDLSIIDKNELGEVEPHVSALYGLYSSSTGIVDSHRLMQYLLGVAEENGAVVAYNSEVVNIEKLHDGYKVSVKNNNDMLVLKTRVLINSAGIDADIIAAMAGIDVENAGYRLHFCKGRYFRVNSAKSSLIHRLIYPVPKPKRGGLGIHATLDLGGALRLGPDDEYLEKREKDYSIDNSGRHIFYESVNKFLPFIEENDLTADMAGIRPKLQGPRDDFRDFVIQEEADKGFAGFINLIGIESPGLTASLAIGRYVRGIIKRKDGLCVKYLL